MARGGDLDAGDCIGLNCGPAGTAATSETLSLSKRGNGEGSIYQRADGIWCCALIDPGVRRKVIYGRTRQEVASKLRTALQAREAGTLADSRRMTVGEYLDTWLSEVVKPSARNWTYLGYETAVRLHLKPTLGRLRLDRLTPIQVQSLLNAKRSEGLSPKYVKNIRAVLRGALNQAVRWGLLGRNVASLVEPPRVERYEIKPLTPVEARAFLAAIRGDRLEGLYSVALTMGLRQGEALGMRWSDVDLDIGSLRVEKQLQRIGGRLQLVELKTKLSRRALVMPSSIVASLREHHRRQLDDRSAAGEMWVESGLVFTTPDGRPLEGSTVTRHFHGHLERAGLSQRRFHDLRHSCATLLLVQGVSPRVVMDVLGHSDIGMTMNTYSHVIPELRRDAADRMDDLLGGRER